MIVSLPTLRHHDKRERLQPQQAEHPKETKKHARTWDTGRAKKHVCACACMCARVRVSACVCACACVCMCMCAPVHMCICACAHPRAFPCSSPSGCQASPRWTTCGGCTWAPTPQRLARRVPGEQLQEMLFHSTTGSFPAYEPGSQDCVCLGLLSGYPWRS